MHAPVTDQHRWLCQVLSGHYAYYGLMSNFRSLNTVSQQVRRIWFPALGRGSQRRLTWDRFQAVLERFPLLTPWITRHCGG